MKCIRNTITWAQLNYSRTFLHRGHCKNTRPIMSIVNDLSAQGVVSQVLIMSEQQFNKPQRCSVTICDFFLNTTLFVREFILKLASLERKTKESNLLSLSVCELHWHFQPDWCLPQLNHVSVLACSLSLSLLTKSPVVMLNAKIVHWNGLLPLY